MIMDEIKTMTAFYTPTIFGKYAWISFMNQTTGEYGAIINFRWKTIRVAFGKVILMVRWYWKKKKTKEKKG